MSTPIIRNLGSRKFNSEEKLILQSSLMSKLIDGADNQRERNLISIISPLKNTNSMTKQNCANSKYCLKCFFAKRLWMVSVNMYDFMGLLDICPCGTLHSVRPYISYKIKYK